jgi:hypothetical protein
MSLNPSGPEPTSIEQGLRQLIPAPSHIDRDRLMFQAGAISGKAGLHHRWVWPSIAAVLALVAVSESIALAVRPSREIVVQVPAPAARGRLSEPESIEILSQAPPDRTWAPDPWLPTGTDSLDLKRQVLRFGLEGLPDPPPLLTQSQSSSGPDADSGESRLLHRYEFNKVIDLGGPS